MKIGEEGHNKTFSYAYIILSPRVKRENFYINQANLKKCAFLMVSANWWSESWHLSNSIPLNAFPNGLAEEPCSLLLTFWPYLPVPCVTFCAVLGSKFCPVCRLCHFTLHLAFHFRGPQIVFWTHPSWVAGKYICHELACHFRLILAFFDQKVPKIWRGNGLNKK